VAHLSPEAASKAYAGEAAIQTLELPQIDLPAASDLAVGVRQLSLHRGIVPGEQVLQVG